MIVVEGRGYGGGGVWEDGTEGLQCTLIGPLLVGAICGGWIPFDNSSKYSPTNYRVSVYWGPNNNINIQSPVTILFSFVTDAWTLLNSDKVRAPSQAGKDALSCARYKLRVGSAFLGHSLLSCLLLHDPSNCDTALLLVIVKPENNGFFWLANGLCCWVVILSM